MAKSRRKAGAAKARCFKEKKMGKGWSAHHKVRSLVKLRPGSKAASIQANADQAAREIAASEMRERAGADS